MRAPLAFVAAAFALGIALAWWLNPPVWLLAVVSGAIGLLILRRQKQPPQVVNGLLLILAMTAGALRAGVDETLPADSIARSLTPAVRPIACQGRVASEVEWFRPVQGPVRRQGWLELTAVRQKGIWIPASGRLFLRLPIKGVELLYGDCVHLHGEIRGPRPPAEDSRVFGEARWLWLRGASGVLTVADSEAIERCQAPTSKGCLAPMPGTGVWHLWIWYRRWAASFRWQLKEMGRSLLGPLEAGYLEAFLLGDGRGIPRETWEAFKKTGVVHVLVVSGSNVGLIGAIGLIALSFIRVPRAFRYRLLSVGLITYCILTGSDPPILRATIMGVLLCLGQAAGREVSVVNSLGLAAFLILATDPRALADASFQLSFVAVLGLFTLSPWFAKWLKVNEGSEGTDPLEKGRSTPESETILQRWKRTLWRWAAQGLAASCGAWVAVSPVVAWHFHMFTPIALIANLIVVPWASLLIACGFLLCTVGMIHPTAAAPLAASFSWLAQGLSRVVQWAASLPGASWSW